MKLFLALLLTSTLIGCGEHKSKSALWGVGCYDDELGGDCEVVELPEDPTADSYVPVCDEDGK